MIKRKYSKLHDKTKIRLNMYQPNQVIDCFSRYSETRNKDYELLYDLVGKDRQMSTPLMNRESHRGRFGRTVKAITYGADDPGSNLGHGCFFFFFFSMCELYLLT